jgi:hypothetical protein
MLYDVFISHASEDKESFVRPLARKLINQNVSVWYDEFTLLPGDSLCKSIDIGLSQSRYGIVIISKAFFDKKWTNWEIDGLVQRQLFQNEKVIIPIWLDVSLEDVVEYSLPLSNIIAIIANKGMQHVIDQLMKVLKPEGSSIIIARDILIDYGMKPPIVTDDWWHSAIEYCGSNPMEDTFQSSMGWGRWGFPLPEKDDSVERRGERIAWSAMQLEWMKKPMKMK